MDRQKCSDIRCSYLDKPIPVFAYSIYTAVYRLCHPPHDIAQSVRPTVLGDVMGR